jgi:spore maturation protein CgeB
MTICIVGDWRYNFYEKALADGFVKLGYTVDKFVVSDYLNTSMLSKIEQKLGFGTRILLMRKHLIKYVKEKKPNVVFFHRTLFFDHKTVLEIKKINSKIIVISYNNDNPFLKDPYFSIWRYYVKLIQFADINYFYRDSNILYAKKIGINNPKLLLSYYTEELHFPAKDDSLHNDVVFIGHFEKDERANFISYLYNKGLRLFVCGNRWKTNQHNFPVTNQQMYGEKYNKLITNSSIALVFLSKENDDTYTRRCFEIPACGGFMLAPRTSTLEALFVEGEEIIFYSDKEDLYNKAVEYISNPFERERIIANANKKVKALHSNHARAMQIHLEINDYLSN